VIMMILENHHKLKVLRREVLKALVDSEFLGIVSPQQQLDSFTPQLEIFKIWTDRVKIPPKRYIGVGYKDHGNLSSALSWREQQIDGGQVKPRLSVLLFFLRLIFEEDFLSRNLPPGKSFRLTRPQRSKQEKV
jgi:hypothetical protein